uniref:MFS domain-containing protein n=1 Tax=Caenorhabditis tropicalis TaxID=1561998 RepID=A0A1I7V0H8_9PELO
MWYDINRFHIFAFLTWQYANIFAGQNLFGIYSNNVPKWKCGDSEPTKDCGIYVSCPKENLTFVDPSFQSAAMEFFVGLSVGGMLVVYCAWIMEVILPQQRMVVRGIFHCGWTRIILASICYFTKEWRMASFTYAFSMIPALLLVIFVIPESPVWLHSKGFKERMIESELQIARIAGIPYVPVNHKYIKPKKLIETLKTKGMLKKLMILWSMWFTVAICGCAMDLNSGNLAGDLFVNQLSFGVFIIIGKLFLLIVDTCFTSFKRRMLHQISLIGVLVCIIILTFFLAEDYHGIGVLLFYILGTIFIEFVWDACYLGAIELMETSSRASATGSCSLVARIGFILAPLLIHANTWWPFAVNFTVIILGASNLLISYFFLPESKGVNLDDVHVDDSDDVAEQEPMVQKNREKPL